MRKEDLSVLLGAADPEMQAIENLLRDCGIQYFYATVGGVRVRPGNAYQADGYVTPDGVTVAIMPEDWAGFIVLVECNTGSRYPKIIIDHHRPGDPGYGKGPAEFWRASSLGQVVTLLESLQILRWDHDAKPSLAGWVSAGGVPVLFEQEAHLCAAADHCLAAAYRDECPGVDPDELMKWRVRSRAEFQGRPESEVLRDIEAARIALRDADQIPLGHIDAYGVCTGCGCNVAEDYCICPRVTDMRGQHVPELPEASAREGMCFIADGLQDCDGRIKVVCQSGTPEQIRAFMEVWAPAQGLTDIYGDPARGFAGGYLKQVCVAPDTFPQW